MAPQRRSHVQSPRKGSNKDSSARGSRSSKANLSPLQQSLASVFSQSFTQALASGPNELHERIQRLKTRLYARDFAAAFSDAADLETYALRWSPPRALAYHELLCSSGMRKHVREVLLRNQKVGWGRMKSEQGVDGAVDGLNDLKIDEHGEEVHIAAFGAGPGAELVALAGVLVSLQDPDQDPDQESEDEDETESLPRLIPPIRLHIVDVGPWQSVLSALESTLGGTTFTSTMSAAAASPASPTTATAPSLLNAPLPPSSAPKHLSLSYTQRDILDLSTADLQTMVGSARLVTFLFTLNELYAASKGKTTVLLLRLTDLLPAGALLLVVDSPGSYATVDVGAGPRRGGGGASVPAENVESAASAAPPVKRSDGRDARLDQSKTYPMHWLLDHTLLEAASVRHDADAHKSEGKDQAKSQSESKSEEQAPPERRRRWTKVYEDRSRWFRLPQDLAYPLPLEDMRYQVHCYRRI